MHQKTQNHFLKFSIHLSVRKSREKLQTNIWKILSKPLEKFKHRYAPKMFKYNPLLCSFSLQLIFFFRKADLRKVFDIRFSYKHCNFSHVCLLVKMASKTVTRSIHKQDASFEGTLQIFPVNYCGHCHFSTRFPRVLL